MSLFDALGNQAADLDAINVYFNQTTAKNPQAAKLKESWYQWFNSLSFLQKNTDGDVVKEASNRRNAFNIANVNSPAEAEQLKEQFSYGVTREEMQGQPRVADAAGNYPTVKGVTVASAAKGTVPSGARPTIKQGSRGEAVKAWQAVIGATQDGVFGPQTTAATKQWQKAHGLVADGVVGTATWSAALGGVNAPNMSFAQASVTPVAPVTTSGSKVPAGMVAQIPSLKVVEPARPAVAPAPSIVTASETPAVNAKPVTKAEVVAVKTASFFNPESWPNWAKWVGGGLSALALILTIKKGPPRIL